MRKISVKKHLQSRRVQGLIFGGALVGLILISRTLANADPFLWLEEIDGEKALSWVRGQNEISKKALEGDPLFEPIFEKNKAILNSTERIPLPAQRGAYLYNFWQDSAHVRGLVRRTSRESYRKPEPVWETVLDVDALAAAEKENWVYKRNKCRYPDYDRCIVSLSRGGGDAVVQREFDLQTKEFVDGGFFLPEAKSDIVWRDRDSVFVTTDFGKDSLTASGYPRIVKIWKRGTPLAEAQTVFEGEKEDVSVDAERIWDGDAYDIIMRRITFFTAHHFLYRDEKLIKLDLPEDAILHDIFKGELLVELRSDWVLESGTYQQGSLLAIDLERFLTGGRDFDALFVPGERSSLHDVRATHNYLVISILENVTNHLVVATLVGGKWKGEKLEAPTLGSLSLVSSEEESDTFFFTYTGFLSPPSLYQADAASGKVEVIKSQPAFFDATGMRVEQREVASADGTLIPYFVVYPKAFLADGKAPTLLYGYGGFEYALTPWYLGIVGTAWLERGGVYVVANIRGGGEFGPKWHQAALKENRQRAFDDFIAVAQDLIAQRITSSRHLGIMGGSNGGLLVGATFVQRPELFNAVVCSVPLLDMKRYHLLLAGASWMGEYGNPDIEEEWAYISKYSPYQNVKKEAHYPRIFFSTSTRDDRVHPGHARKMTAKMLEKGHDVLYYENIEGGHGGAANLNQRAYLEALAYVYLHQQLDRQ